jgi:hypothetical protein
MILDVLLVMLVTRMLGVFFLAPVIATGATVLHVHNSPTTRPWIIALFMLTGLFVPLALELTSVLPPSYSFHDGNILVSSAVVRLDRAPILVSLSLFFALNGVMVALLTAAVRRRDAKSELQLRLMAWQLAQLAPR